MSRRSTWSRSPTLWAVALLALPAGARAGSPSWVDVGGNTRVVFEAFEPGADPALPAGASCTAMVAVASDGARVTEVPWDADRRVSRDCAPAVLQVAQAASGGWRLGLQAWTPDATASLPVTFTAQEDGQLVATIRAESYLVSSSQHPAGLELVEEAQLQRAPKLRYPRAAKEQVAAGALPASVTCRMTLTLTAEGRVSAVSVDDCPAPLAPTVQALGARYRFSPRLVNGEAVATQLPVALQLRAD